ncbi:MAG TPA: 3-oxoacyl-[acyl-carrier-protein] synthase III C-terminal domain-containing protein [Polyangiaceae bacterium]|jgi:3-oxoacyl-[acyl-carrier-protein] synthase-3|nr:3-oxoacyl-[acyl-carrier-protein] synthase III C-terminal domain-containing protein [Polyangiaceae bacterium]
MSVSLYAHAPAVGITALGHALPEAIRDNHDPVFDSLTRQGTFAGLFTGYDTRRVLGAGESLAGLVHEAASAALARAKVAPQSVRLFAGYASASEYVAPNELYRVHELLGLADSAEVLPIADEFTPFLSGLRVSADRLLATPNEVALVATGCHWTKNVDYADPVSASIGDGAGAAVVQRLDAEHHAALRIVAHACTVQPASYGSMRLGLRQEAWPSSLPIRPLFTMLPESAEVFRQWGVSAPPELVQRLLQATTVRPSEVTCIAHQASRYLLDAWQTALRPMRFLDSLSSLGNMTLASIPVTLSLFAHRIETPYVLLLGLGLGIHAKACLLSRWQPG